MVDFTIIGVTHPYKGGIAQHTTTLARRLTGAGRTVDIASWRHQYPRRLYPGEMYVPDGEPEIPVHDRVRSRLRWFWPGGWVAEGLRLRRTSVAVFVIVNPVQAVAYLTMLLVLRGSGTRTVALCHNVMPHERRSFDEWIVTRLLGRCDVAITHSAEEAERAGKLGTARVLQCELPPSLPARRSESRQLRSSETEPVRLVFFGLVREYKGLDVLIEAMAYLPTARLRVRGEFWGGTDAYEQQAAAAGVSDRVTLEDGYVPTHQIPAFFEDADLAVLPYRSATASGAALLALDNGVPVVVSAVGALRTVIADETLGLSCPPDDAAALADTIARASSPVALKAFDDALLERQAHQGALWQIYVDMMLDIETGDISSAP